MKAAQILSLGVVIAVWLPGPVVLAQVHGNLAYRDDVIRACSGAAIPDNFHAVLAFDRIKEHLRAGRYDDAEKEAGEVLQDPERTLRRGATPVERECALTVQKVSKEAKMELRAAQAKDDAARAQAETERAKPPNRLRTLYVDYIEVQACYESRKEFAVRYVTRQEMDDARAVTRRQEQALLKQHPELSAQKDALWEQAKREYGNSLLATILRTAGTTHNSHAEQQCKVSAMRYTSDQQNQERKIKKDF